MRYVMVGLLCVLVGLQYQLWAGEDSVFHLKMLREKLKTQVDHNKQLLKRNQQMAVEIEALKSGDQALEEHARYDLGMIKQDETYYHFID